MCPESGPNCTNARMTAPAAATASAPTSAPSPAVSAETFKVAAAFISARPARDPDDAANRGSAPGGLLPGLQRAPMAFVPETEFMAGTSRRRMRSLPSKRRSSDAVCHWAWSCHSAFVCDALLVGTGPATASRVWGTAQTAGAARELASDHQLVGGERALEEGADTQSRRRAAGRGIRAGPQASALAARAAQRRRARRGGRDRAGARHGRRAPSSRTWCSAGPARSWRTPIASRCCATPTATASPRSSIRIPGRTAAAVRNGADRRPALRRQHRQRRALSLPGRRYAHHRQGHQAPRPARRPSLDARPACQPRRRRSCS